MTGFLSRPQIFAKYSIVRTYTKFLSRPLLSAIVIITFVPNTSFDHFKTLNLVCFQDHGRNAHSIEIDRYVIDDIDVLRTFHSISRSRSVAAISNDTDPDGKTKILTKLQVKLSNRNVADIMEVKVDDGAEVNILPLHTFRSMFPHKLDEDGYPKDDALRGSKTTLQCYDDGKLVNHGTITL